MVLQQSDSPEMKNGDNVNCDRTNNKKSIGTTCDNDGDLEIGKFNESDAHMRLDVNKNAQTDGNQSDKFFVRYRGKNYEINDLLTKHPGGRGTLGSFKGLALDKIFNDVPHSDAAFHLFEEFVVDNQREYDDIENLINWNEPLLGQVGKMADRYWEWVNLPVNRSIRLFKSDFLENLTITPWYAIPMIWVPASLLFLYLGFVTNKSTNAQYTFPAILLAVLFGILIWTFIEYTLHRNLFHLRPPAGSKILITLHFILHGVHHKAPFDNQRLLFPPAAAVLVATVFFKIYSAVLPDVILYFVATGTMAGYLCYDLMHYYLHHGSPEAESYLYVMKRYHNHHHFSHHEQGFGISSRLWDFMFGSSIKLKQLRKAIVW